MTMEMKGMYRAPEYPLRPNGQPDPVAAIGCGPCDPLSEKRPQAAEPWGYSTGLITLAQDAAGNLVLPAEQQVLRLFVSGDMDTGASQGYPDALTDVQTDSYREGALVKAGEKFVTTQIGIHFGRVCRLDGVPRAGGPAGAPFTQVYEPWMDAYNDKIREVLRDNLSLSFVMGDDKCERVLGVPAFWPEHSDSEFGVSSITPLRVPFRAGEKDAVDKLVVQVETGFGIQISNDLLDPTQSSLSVPMRVVLYGYVECSMAACEVLLVPQQQQQQQQKQGYAQPVQPYQQQGIDPRDITSAVVSALSDPGMRPHLQRILGAPMAQPTAPQQLWAQPIYAQQPVAQQQGLAQPMYAPQPAPPQLYAAQPQPAFVQQQPAVQQQSYQPQPPQQPPQQIPG